MSFPFGEPVTQHSRGIVGQDVDGNDVYGDTDTPHEGVAVYPRESVELTAGQSTNIIGLVLVFKPAIAVAATDEFTVRGNRHVIDADPGQYASPLTGTNLTRVNLTRVEG